MTQGFSISFFLVVFLEWHPRKVGTFLGIIVALSLGIFMGITQPAIAGIGLATGFYMGVSVSLLFDYSDLVLPIQIPDESILVISKVILQNSNSID